MSKWKHEPWLCSFLGFFFFWCLFVCFGRFITILQYDIIKWKRIWFGLKTRKFWCASTVFQKKITLIQVNYTQDLNNDIDYSLYNNITYPSPFFELYIKYMYVDSSIYYKIWTFHDMTLLVWYIFLAGTFILQIYMIVHMYGV